MSSLINPVVQKKIIANFSKAAPTYDDYSELQKKIGIKSLNILKKLMKKNLHFQTILDIGCGTGWLTEKLFETYHPKAMGGIDISPEMIRYAKEKYKHSKVIYQVGSAGDGFSPFKQVDLIVANMSLQWVHSLEKVFKNYFSLLTPGGLMATSFMLKGTFGEWREMYHKVTQQKLPEWLLSPKEIIKQAEKGQLKTLNRHWQLLYSEVAVEKKTFASLRDFARHQRNIGATNPFSHWQKITKFEYRTLEDIFQKKGKTTYKTGIFIWQNKEMNK